MVSSRTMGIATAAVRTRFINGFASSGTDKLGLQTAVTPFAFLKRDDRFVEVLPVEVRPQRFGDPDFGISDLPEQEIADTQFPAGPYQQIRIRLPRGVEIPGKVVF